MASLNFQLEQAKIRASTDSVQIKHTLEEPVPRETPSVLPRNISGEKQFPKWTSFEFVTKEWGAKGPTKSECIGYYSEIKEFLGFINVQR